MIAKPTNAFLERLGRVKPHWYVSASGCANMT
jgi:hypothetical protein